jgi:GT2 family glycosyltransferase/ubiquinone/menaquinone biosynthesis C-methylase UbiE
MLISGLNLKQSEQKSFIEEEMEPRVSIVILNWNGWQDTIECLESLYRINYSNYDVIVVDNGSTDDSIEKIREYCAGKRIIGSKYFKYDASNKPIKIFEVFEHDAKMGNFDTTLYDRIEARKRMILIKAKANYGYSGGNNLGIMFASKVFKPDYFLVLNNDVVVDKTFLSELVKVAIKTRAGIVGPKNYLYSNPSILWLAWFDIDMKRGKPILVMPRTVDRGDGDQVRRVPFIAGSCLLIRKDVIQNIGLFDEEYFCYWDETDYCMRARKAGYEILYAPSSKIWHKVSSSAKALAEYYITRNRFLFMKKHASNEELDSFLLWFFLVDFWLKIASIFIHHRRKETLRYFCKGVKDGVFSLLVSRRDSKVINALRRLYSIFSQTLWTLNFNKAIESTIASKLLNPRKCEEVLEVACGGGIYSKKLTKHGCEVFGIDVNKKAIKRARIITGGKCHLVVSRAEELPFCSGVFDKVVCMCALEHFRDDEKALAEMRRVLKDNGVLVLTVDSFTYRVENHLKEKHKKDHGVVNYYSLPSLKMKLKSIGFTLIEHRYFVNSPLSSFFFKLGIKKKFGYSYKAIFPLAYPLGVLSDKLLGDKEKGYFLAVKAMKT